jgi:hypothetical protein
MAGAVVNPVLVMSLGNHRRLTFEPRPVGFGVQQALSGAW